MKICFLIGTLGRGGAEKQLLYQLRALKEQSIETTVLCLTRGEIYEPEIAALDIPIEWVGASTSRLARLKKIIERLRQLHPDIIQSTHFYTNIYAGFAGRRLNIPSIGAIRGDLISEMRQHGILGRWQIRLPEILITNSAAVYRNASLDRRLKNKITLVQNAVEISKAVETGQKSKSAETINFLWVGRLDENKKPERFIRLAAALLKKEFFWKLRFTVAGDGKRRAELENLARELQLLPDKLRFLGDCAAMNEIYDQSDVLVSTSDCEGTPNVILEAMAHRLPVIAPRVGGIPDILNEKCGILVAPGDSDELLRAAGKLINDAKLRIRLGKNACDYVEANHSLEMLKAKLPQIYHTLRRGKQPFKLTNERRSVYSQPPL